MQSFSLVWVFTVPFHLCRLPDCTQLANLCLHTTSPPTKETFHFPADLKISYAKLSHQTMCQNQFLSFHSNWHCSLL